MEGAGGIEPPPRFLDEANGFTARGVPSTTAPSNKKRWTMNYEQSNNHSLKFFLFRGYGYFCQLIDRLTVFVRQNLPLLSNQCSSIRSYHLRIFRELYFASKPINQKALDTWIFGNTTGKDNIGFCGNSFQ